MEIAKTGITNSSDACQLSSWCCITDCLEKKLKHKPKKTPSSPTAWIRKPFIKSELQLWNLAISISKMLHNHKLWHLQTVWLLLVIIYSLQDLCLIISTLLFLQLSLWDQTLLSDTNIHNKDLIIIIIKLKLLKTREYCFDTVRTAPDVICLQRLISIRLLLDKGLQCYKLGY